MVFLYISTYYPSQDLDIFYNHQFLDNKDTFIKVTRASLRWVPDSGKRRPLKDACKDAWLFGIEDEDLESDKMSSYGGNVDDRSSRITHERES